MATFVRNNIRYRSAASKALEGYYNSKAFILNELVKPENGFGENAKEIILLLFNQHAEWLFHTEALLLDKQTVSAEDVAEMQRGLERIARTVDEILYEHDEVFNQEFVRHWTTIHRQKFLVLSDMVADVKGMSQIIAFPYVTECLVEYLNSTLFEMYELDCLLGSSVSREVLSTNDTQSDTMVLHIDDLSVQYSVLSGVSAERERVAYYEQHILTPNATLPVRVRDYVVKACSEEPRVEVLTGLKTFLADKPWVDGITVINPQTRQS